jgi:C4-dicarboxylate transporter DctM subunit
MSIAGIILVFTFLAATGAAVPVAVAVAIAGVVVIFLQGLPIILLAHRMVVAADSFTLIAIPGFMLIGSLMSRAGLVHRLVDLCMALVGWVRGGLSIAAMPACMIFGGISGSGTADTAAVGSVMIPALIKSGYDPAHTAALIAAGGAVGIIVPPSIPMIIYGLSSNTSIPALFIGGYVPGLLLTVCYSLYLYFIAKRRGYGVVQEFSAPALGKAFKRAFWALLAPIIIVGGIVSGIVTTTESGIIGVAYVLFLGFVIHRELRVRDLFPAVLETAVLTGVVMFLLTACSLFSLILARENVPDTLANAVLAMTSNRVVVLLLINMMVIFLGCLMEPVAIIIILTPVLLPISKLIGMDPVHFGVMFVFNLAIGLIHPPVGYCLFVSSSIARVPIEKVSWKIIPFFLIAIGALMVVTYSDIVGNVAHYVQKTPL